MNNTTGATIAAMLLASNTFCMAPVPRGNGQSYKGIKRRRGKTKRKKGKR